MSLHEQIAVRLNVHPDEAKAALSSLVQYIRLKATVGEPVTIQGLGTFTMGEDRLLFSTDPSLSELVNHRYSGFEDRAVTPRMEIELPPLDKVEPVLAKPSPALEPMSPSGLATAPVTDETDVDFPEEDWEEEAVWEQPTTDDAAHPLGPLSDPPLETADFLVLDEPVDQPPDDSPFLKVGIGELEAGDEAEIPSEAFGILQSSAPPPMVTSPTELDDTQAPADNPPPPSSLPEPAPDRHASSPASRTSSDKQGTKGGMIRWGGFIALALILGGTAGYFILRPGTKTDPPEVITARPPVSVPSSQADSQMTASPLPVSIDSVDASSPAAVLSTEAPPVTPIETPAAPPATGLHGGIDRAAGGYALIVGSAISRTQADAVLQDFADRQMPSDVLTSTDAEGVTRYRIGLGQFPTLDAADAMRQEMADQLPEGTWILRITSDM